MKISPWVQQTTGLEGWWVAVQFDRAVSWFGRYIESKLDERDQHGEPLYTLEGLLQEPDVDNKSGIAALSAIFGVINR